MYIFPKFRWLNAARDGMNKNSKKLTNLNSSNANKLSSEVRNRSGLKERSIPSWKESFEVGKLFIELGNNSLNLKEKVKLSQVQSGRPLKWTVMNENEWSFELRLKVLYQSGRSFVYKWTVPDKKVNGQKMRKCMSLTFPITIGLSN